MLLNKTHDVGGVVAHVVVNDELLIVMFLITTVV